MNKKQDSQIQQSQSKHQYFFINNSFDLGRRESEENYNQIYQELSEGVYESSDAYQVEDGHYQQQQISKIESRLIKTQDHQQVQSRIKDVKQSQILQELSNVPEQSEESRQQLKKSNLNDQRCSERGYQTLIQHQKKNSEAQVQKEFNQSQQEQQFFFAQSMSHYESSTMQLYSSNFLKAQDHNHPIDDKLLRILQQDQVNEQTNRILIKSFARYQPINQQTNIKVDDCQEKINQQIKPQKNITQSQNTQKLQSNIAQCYHYSEQAKIQLPKFSKQKQKGTVTISIHGYEKQYFLKMETQIYQVEVCKEDNHYFIKRRFADFATLHQLIRLQYAGYILYPFPQKSLESFKKINFSMGTKQEKIVLSEKRLFQLQKYVNFLFRHHQISHSFLLQIFIQENPEQFQKEINNIYSITQSQENDLQRSLADKGLSNLKKIVRSNFSFLKGYFAPQDVEGKQKIQMLKQRCYKNNEKIGLIKNKHEEYCNKLQLFTAKMHKLALIYKQNSQTPNLQSNIDSILSFGTKLASSRTFYRKLQELISDHILIQGKYYDSILRNIESMLQFRIELLEKVRCLQTSHYSMGVRLQQKIKLFEDRFIEDFQAFEQQFENNIDILYQQFLKSWKYNCKMLFIIWK